MMQAPTTTTPVLVVENISVCYEAYGRKIRAISNLSVCLQAGETTALLGDPASGKTTAARAIMGLLPPTATVTGTLRVQHDLVDLTDTDTLRELQGTPLSFVPEDPRFGLNPMLTVGQQVADAEDLFCDAQAEILGTTDILSAYPRQLSPGETKRVLLAAALACGPQILIFDEPTRWLDFTDAAHVLDILDDVRSHSGMALVLLTSDGAVAVGRSTHIHTLEAPCVPML